MRRSPYLALLAVLALPGCGSAGQLACTLVGCHTGITINTNEVAKTVKGAAYVTLCIGGKCETERASRANLIGFDGSQLRGTVRGDGSYDVTLTVSDRRGAAILITSRNVRHLRKLQPNGAACGPTCYVASLELRAREHQLVERS
jgi:hypothetical protein